MAAGEFSMLKTLIATAALSLTAAPASAEIVARTPDSFTLRYAGSVGVGRGDVFGAVALINEWWDGAHTYSGDAANLTLDTEVGGCFCEALPDGTMFEHGRVIAFDDDHLTLNAPLGPLKGRTTRADLTFSWPENDALLEEDETGVVVVFVVEGPGLGAFADAVDTVMRGQHERLIHRAELAGPASSFD